MVTKSVLIEFADPNIKASDHFKDITNAVVHAQFNLRMRHGVKLRMPIGAKIGVVLEMDIPEEMADNFNFGKRLQGISKYLLDKYHDFYKDYRVGNRLLYYMPVENID